jgi:repressor LexA
MPDDEEELSINEWAGDDDKFALRVQGESMIGDHIADGDFVVIDKRKKVENGAIVALRDDEGDLTLRRYYREKNGQVRLEASGKGSKPVVRNDVEVLGVLVGVVRKY